jgi:hypothetical protein
MKQKNINHAESNPSSYGGAGGGFVQKKLALSKKGAKDFIKGTLCTTLLNIALMLPAVFIFL